jgi:hypothetical protein
MQSNVSAVTILVIAKTQTKDEVVKRDLARAARISVTLKLVINVTALLGNRNHDHLRSRQLNGLIAIQKSFQLHT